MSENYASKVIEIAEAEVGYLEKKSNSNLDSKTANAGSGNYTKYSRDLVSSIGSPFAQGVAWCQIFVVWVFIKAFGLTEAKKLLGGWSAYTPTSAQYYKNMGQWFTSKPQVGDQIFFKNSTRICHTGIVYKVDSSKVYTIEGNTSGASGVIANGGGVCKKSYSLTNSSIAGYGRPKYDVPSNTSSKIVQTTYIPQIKAFQTWLNSKYKSNLSVDGQYGSKTKKATVKALQQYLNNTFKFALAVDGDFGPKTQSACSKCQLRNGSRNDAVYILQGLLYANVFDAGGFDGIFGSKTESALRNYQTKHGLVSDGICGPITWQALLK